MIYTGRRLGHVPLSGGTSNGELGLPVGVDVPDLTGDKEGDIEAEFERSFAVLRAKGSSVLL